MAEVPHNFFWQAIRERSLTWERKISIIRPLSYVFKGVLETYLGPIQGCTYYKDPLSHAKLL